MNKPMTGEIDSRTRRERLPLYCNNVTTGTTPTCTVDTAPCAHINNTFRIGPFTHIDGQRNDAHGHITQRSATRSDRFSPNTHHQ